MPVGVTELDLLVQRRPLRMLARRFVVGMDAARDLPFRPFDTTSDTERFRPFVAIDTRGAVAVVAATAVLPRIGRFDDTFPVPNVALRTLCCCSLTCRHIVSQESSTAPV